jgi:hypothetical protein
VLYPIDQLEVKLEQPAHEVDDKPQILFAVGKLLERAGQGGLEPPTSGFGDQFPAKLCRFSKTNLCAAGQLRATLRDSATAARAGEI